MPKMWIYFYSFFLASVFTAQEANTWLTRCLSEENPTFFAQLGHLDANLKKELVQKLLPYLKEEKMHLRCQAIKSLGALGQEASICASELQILLQDPDLLVRMETAHTLFLFDPSQAPLLLLYLLPAFQQQQLILRIRALEMLEVWKLPASVPIILPLLQDPEWTLRRMTARTLGQIASREALPALSERLEKERNVQVLQESIRALKEIEFSDLEILHLLEELLAHTSFFVRIEASKTLEKKTGKKFGVQPDCFQERVAIFSTLSAEEQAQLIDECLETLASDGNGEMRLSASEALLQLNQRREIVLTALASFLEHHQPKTRLRTVKILEKFASSHEVPLLVEFLQDSARQVRYTAAGALGKLGKDASSALPALFQSMSDPDAYVRMWSVWALGQIDANESFSALQVALNDPHHEVRRTAQEALKRVR